MKTKKQFTNRILSLVLALVMVVGLLPMTAFAATEVIDFSSRNTPVISYSDGVTQYFKFNNYLYQVTYTNLIDCTNVGLRNSEGNITLYYKSSYTSLVRPEISYLRLFKIENSRYYEFSELPTTQGGSLDCYIQRAMLGYAIDTAQPVATINCIDVNEPTWSWTDTSSATATFTATDADVFATAEASISSEIVSEAENCQTKKQTDYTATVTFNGQTYTDTKTVYGDAGPHSLEYTVSGNTLTETCANGCGHSAKATLTTPQESYTYTGGFIMPAVLSYDENWKGKKASYTDYKDNVNVGTATVSSDPAGKKITTTFEIKAADIADAEIAFDPEHASYHGIAQKPDVYVSFNGKSLTENTDYTLSWDKSGFRNADNYTATVTGKGNFEGTKDAVFRINPAEIKEAGVTLDQNTFVYDGQPHNPTAVVIFEGEILTEDVDYEVYYLGANQIMKRENGEPVKFFGTGKENSDSINAGQYYAVVFGKGNFADNGRFACAPYTIEKATVTEPTIASKPYNGSVQTADIADTDLYTVVENNGGTGVKQNGYYDVVLELKDSANYQWSSTDDAQVTVPFSITRATNEWTVYPSISGWTYGKSANEPVGAAKFGEISAEYSGTANDGTTYSSTIAPTKAGNYTATVIVAETEDYSGLETSVDFTVAKAQYNMRGAMWNYTAPFQYDGKEHKVEVVGLPAGVTVKSYENNTATAVSDYYAEVNLAYDANNYNAPTIGTLGWTIYNDWTPTEYTSTTPNGNGWLNSDFVITANDGYKVSLTNIADGDWKDDLTYSGETADGSVTFYLKNETDGTISLAKTVTYKLDKTAPTGKVEFVERTGWEEFVNTITFGLFYKDEVTVKTTANDNLSGIDKIEYASADKAMTLEEVKAITDWTEYTDSFGVTLENTKKFVYFVRITDNAGNVIYLSTDGAEYDTTAPVIEGVENGKTYYTTQKITVTDKNIDSITLNGEAAGSEITLEGNKESTYTIIVTDKAGNETTVTVTMKPIKELAKATENLGNDNVTSADAPALKELVEILDELIADPDTSEDGEKETLEQHKAIAESLLETIEAAADATDTENTEKVENVTPENVTPENKTDLENAKADLEKALEVGGGNYTEDEKKAIEDEIKRIDDALKAIENVKNVEELIDKIPENVTKNDEAAIKAAGDAYNVLSDYEKSLVDKAAKKALTDAKAALAELNKPADTDSPQTADNSNMFLWIALLFISGGAVITLTVVDRKRRKASKR